MGTRVSIWGLRYVAQRMGLLVLWGVCLFVAAGSWGWLRGWATVGVSFVCELVMLVLLAVRAPETLNQRGTGHEGVKSFDAIFAVLWLVLSFGMAVVAGLDCVRFGWSSFSWLFFAIGVGLIGGATAFGTWAMLENEHFEQFVRIQSERKHRVVTTGPYRVVRHPGYLAAVLSAIAAPMLLGSAWSFVPAVLMIALFVWRTSREDRTLREELEGYAQYTETTRHRLVPRLW